MSLQVSGRDRHIRGDLMFTASESVHGGRACGATAELGYNAYIIV